MSYNPTYPIVPDIIASVGNQRYTPSSNEELLNKFRQDQLYAAPTAQPDLFVTYKNHQVKTEHRWPIGIDIDVTDKQQLEELFAETGAVAAAALLFIYHKVYQHMDAIPGYLSNPAFLGAHGKELKSTFAGALTAKARNDVKYRFYRLLQAYPIMFETMAWLSEESRSVHSLQMLKAGFPNSIHMISEGELSAEVLHEAISTAKRTKGNRVVPPSPQHYLLMYQHLLSLGGASLVSATELVEISLISWDLTWKYILEREMPFNDVLSVVLTMFHRSNEMGPLQCVNVIQMVYDYYKPLDQWPTVDHVIRHAGTVVGGHRFSANVSTTPNSALDHRLENRTPTTYVAKTPSFE